MDDTQDLKRRNLMLTTVAVITAAFLGLKLPALASILPNSNEFVSATWRVWAAAGAFIVYQFWRWSTSGITNGNYAKIAGFFRDEVHRAITRSVVRSAVGKLRKREAVTNLEFTTALPDDPDILWKTARITNAYTNAGGMPNKYRDEITVQYSIRNSKRTVTFDGSLRTKYRFSANSRFRCIVEATVRTAWGSTSFQDVAVPWILTPISLGICAFKIASLHGAG